MTAPVRSARTRGSRLVRAGIWAGLTGLTVLASATARAQAQGPTLADTATANSVGARSKAAYDPPGIGLGAFTLYPTLAARIEYDDNVFNVENERHSDGRAIIVPGLSFVNAAPDHGLTLRADATLVRYADLSLQNNEQYQVEGQGYLALGEARIDMSGGYGRLTEQAGSLGEAVIGAPNTYTRLAGRAGVTLDLAGITFNASGGAEQFDYRTVHLEDEDVLQNYRDRTAYSISSRLGLRAGSSLRVFVQGYYNWQDYRENFGGLSQNSQGYSVLGGVSFGLTALMSGEISVGYLSQDYDEPGSGTVSGLTYAGRIIWNPTALMTAKLNVDRALEASPYYNQPGVIRDGVDLDLDYELLRNLIVSVTVGYRHYDYFGSDRRDSQFRAGLDARWLIGRNLELGLGLSHRDQSSHGFQARPFTGNAALLSLRIKG
ncbi:outer membrane beta-barrel protein [Novosphingobium profundi]|uniref:outer membrane beta-barrel protein n=1 Tax=Novosphingobium profundi TaxID=1774954 RepID=UPI001BDA2759|nr:outer membrane beta-barrel protein [Novosphingobium profundi]MBT0668696.1 outer membrane beta-barrel protein [Novosphingobium profundi]